MRSHSHVCHSLVSHQSASTRRAQGKYGKMRPKATDFQCTKQIFIGMYIGMFIGMFIGMYTKQFLSRYASEWDPREPGHTKVILLIFPFCSVVIFPFLSRYFPIFFFFLWIFSHFSLFSRYFWICKSWKIKMLKVKKNIPDCKILLLTKYVYEV